MKRNTEYSFSFSVFFISFRSSHFNLKQQMHWIHALKYMYWMHQYIIAHVITNKMLLLTSSTMATAKVCFVCCSLTYSIASFAWFDFVLYFISVFLFVISNLLWVNWITEINKRAFEWDELQAKRAWVRREKKQQKWIWTNQTTRQRYCKGIRSIYFVHKYTWMKVYIQ